MTPDRKASSIGFAVLFVMLTLFLLALAGANWCIGYNAVARWCMAGVCLSSFLVVFGTVVAFLPESKQ